jgi:hypothetical protein
MMSTQGGASQFDWREVDNVKLAGKNSAFTAFTLHG